MQLHKDFSLYVQYMYSTTDWLGPARPNFALLGYWITKTQTDAAYDFAILLSISTK